jgi:C-terminal processing protease CtpA/Prc
LDICPGSACDNTQLQRGDVLTHIDGVCVLGKSITEIPQLSKGEEGSSAKLTVRRGKAVPNTCIELLAFGQF